MNGAEESKEHTQQDRHTVTVDRMMLVIGVNLRHLPQRYFKRFPQKNSEMGIDLSCDIPAFPKSSLVDVFQCSAHQLEASFSTAQPAHN